MINIKHQAYMAEREDRDIRNHIARVFQEYYSMRLPDPLLEEAMDRYRDPDNQRPLLSGTERIHDAVTHAWADIAEYAD